MFVVHYCPSPQPLSRGEKGFSSIWRLAFGVWHSFEVPRG